MTDPTATVDPNRFDNPGPTDQDQALMRLGWRPDRVGEIVQVRTSVLVETPLKGRAHELRYFWTVGRVRVLEDRDGDVCVRHWVPPQGGQAGRWNDAWIRPDQVAPYRGEYPWAQEPG